MRDILSIEVQCLCCGFRFYVCRSCWRGQAYCGERCRRIRQSQLHRKAQRKYRYSKKGKERRRLYEKRKKSKKNGLKPGDDSSIPQKDCNIEPKKRSENRPRCHFCGSIGVVGVRAINGSFAFLEHRFLRKGFWESLSYHELLLYIFLVMVSDQNGLSYYGYEKICRILKVHLNQYIDARDGLLDKDLIRFDGRLFQVLSLPERPVISKSAKDDFRQGNWVSLGETIAEIFREKGYGIHSNH